MTRYIARQLIADGRTFILGFLFSWRRRMQPVLDLRPHATWVVDYICHAFASVLVSGRLDESAGSAADGPIPKTVFFHT